MQFCAVVIKFYVRVIFWLRIECVTPLLQLRVEALYFYLVCRLQTLPLLLPLRFFLLHNSHRLVVNNFILLFNFFLMAQENLLSYAITLAFISILFNYQLNRSLP